MGRRRRSHAAPSLASTLLARPFAFVSFAAARIARAAPLATSSGAPVARAASVALLAVALFTPAASRASTIDAQGQLVFDPDAIFTFGFESVSSAQAAGGAWITWREGAKVPTLSPVLLTAANWASAESGAQNALEGSRALWLSHQSGFLGLALFDADLFAKLRALRVSISFWGRAHGAEPELDVVYARSSAAAHLEPDGFDRVVAIRTGKETTDGWVEYSTGPIDGALWGTDIVAIILTPRYATTGETVALDDPALFPAPGKPQILAPSAYALVDALEVVPAGGSVMPATPCTLETEEADCGDLGSCMYGHCLDSAFIWGPAPSSASMRQEAADRWQFIAQHLGAARSAARRASLVFDDAAVQGVAAAAAPRGFYRTLGSLVAELRDAHASLGEPPSSATAFTPYLEPLDPALSGPLDMCLMLAVDDLPGGTAAPVYAVSWVAPRSIVKGTLARGAILSEIDGVPPDAWMDAYEALFRRNLPDDPSSAGSGRAAILSLALAKYAQKAVFRSCNALGGCTMTTVETSRLSYEEVLGTGVPDTTRYSAVCSPRFFDAVSSWTKADDLARYDVPALGVYKKLTAVQLDGFEAETDPSASNPWHAWEDPFKNAFAASNPVMVDARLGHGGLFAVGNLLAQQIRGKRDPFASYAAPRGAFDDIDPPWITDPMLAACVVRTMPGPPALCAWGGQNSTEALEPHPPGAGRKLAWLNGVDVSMNDIVPRWLSGDAEVRIFGPHASTGAYGEISRLGSVNGIWSTGSIQVLDTRFGSTISDALEAPWATGAGVTPDVVVIQRVSDLLSGHDTALEAAKAWLISP